MTNILDGDRLLVEGGFKGTAGALALKSVVRRLSVLSKTHVIEDLPNPSRDPAAQELLRRLRRAYAFAVPGRPEKPR